MGGGVYLGEIECVGGAGEDGVAGAIDRDGVASGVVGAAGEQGGIDERWIDGEGLRTVVIGVGKPDFAISED